MAFVTFSCINMPSWRCINRSQIECQPTYGLILKKYLYIENSIHWCIVETPLTYIAIKVEQLCHVSLISIHFRTMTIFYYKIWWYKVQVKSIYNYNTKHLIIRTWFIWKNELGEVQPKTLKITIFNRIAELLDILCILINFNRNYVKTPNQNCFSSLFLKKG